MAIFKKDTELRCQREALKYSIKSKQAEWQV